MTDQEIKALARMLDRVDYYRLLKIDRGAHAADIRGAYHAARRRFHPDRFLDRSADLRNAVNQIARRITEAYMVLRDGKKRPTYDKAIVSGAVRYSTEHAEDARSAEDARLGSTSNGRKFYAMAQQEAARGAPAKAVEYLKMALTFEPQNPAFKDHLERLSPPKKKPKG